MYKQLRKGKKYKALGFVEALLAILVAGITSILLMGIAIDTVKQLVRTDQIDEMTQSAIEGSELVKNIADKNKESSDPVFPNISGNQNSCFELKNDTASASFVTDIDGQLVAKCNYDGGQRENCAQDSALGDQLFRVFCISPASDVASGLVVGKVVIGKVQCSSSKDCDIPDYEYYVLTKTPQR